MGRNLRDNFLIVTPTVKELEVEVKAEAVKENLNSIQSALRYAEKQFKVEGKAQRTLRDYAYHLMRMCELNHITELEDITPDSIITYLADGDVSAKTRANRLKAIKAILNRFYENGHLTGTKFWQNLSVKVPQKIKEGTTQEEIEAFLSGLEWRTYTDLRDACAVLLMWETGVRLGTCSQLTIDMINFEDGIVEFPGEVVKNRKAITLPISDRLCELLQFLINENQIMLNELEKRSNYIFLTEQGEVVLKTSTTNNALSKSIRKKARKLGIDNLQCHNIRRGMAKRLLTNKVDIATISHILGHSSLETTTQYLYISNQEAIDTLRKINDKDLFNIKY